MSLSSPKTRMTSSTPSGISPHSRSVCLTRAVRFEWGLFPAYPGAEESQAVPEITTLMSMVWCSPCLCARACEQPIHPT